MKVFITGSEYVPPPPEKLPQEMAKFEKWLNDTKTSLLPDVIMAAELHRKLVTIPPILMNDHSRGDDF